MKQITFPLFQIQWNIQSIAFEIGNIKVYWYGILIAIAFAIAIFLYAKKDGLFGIHFQEILDFFILVIPIAFIGARLYYILFNLSYYQNHIEEIFQIKNGGLAIYGGMIAGTIVAIIFCKKRKIACFDLLDYIVPGLALGQAIGRWGNFFNVEAYGIQTNVPWKMGIWQNGESVYVHPTFLYESISTFLIFLYIHHLQTKRQYSGQITYVYLMLYALERMIVESLRSDSLMWGPVRISRFLSFLLFVVFAGIIGYRKIKKRKTSENP